MHVNPRRNSVLSPMYVDTKTTKIIIQNGKFLFTKNIFSLSNRFCMKHAIREQQN
jgi:hypothetical protein